MPELRHVHHQSVDPVATRRVGFGLRVQPKVLGTVILAGPLRVADKESLLRCQSVTFFKGLAGGLRSPSHMCQDQAAEIRDVLAERQSTIDVYVVDDYVLRVLINDALCPFGELLCVGVAPPVLQVSGGVKLSALVVKAMSQLVADCTARV